MKKIFAVMLAAVLVLGLLAGCSSANAEEGKVFHIWAWDDTFQELFNTYYVPKLPEGITVQWTIYPDEGGVYQQKLDEALANQENLPEQERIDLFLLKPEHDISGYANSEHTRDLAKLGIRDFSDAYTYTVQVASDSKGKVKGAAFWCSPSVLLYRRSIAKDVLRTDDPVQVQNMLSDWDTFQVVAARAREKGYYMTASGTETYRAFFAGASEPWVDENKVLQLDESILAWMNQAELFAREGYVCPETEVQGQMQTDGRTMCFFVSAWQLEEALAMTGAETFGDWAICRGPQAHFRDGTWMMASAWSDNPAVLGDVMNTFLRDAEVCARLVTEEGLVSNNKDVNSTIAKGTDPTQTTEDTQPAVLPEDTTVPEETTDPMETVPETTVSEETVPETTAEEEVHAYGNDFLGGQNDLAVYAEVARSSRYQNRTVYDDFLNESLQACWREYCQGTCTREQALANWYRAIGEKYSEIRIAPETQE